MHRLASEYEILGILLHQVIKADEILPLSLLAYAIGDISENRKEKDKAMILLDRIAENVSLSRMSLEIYAQLLKDYTFSHGRREVLLQIGKCFKVLQKFNTKFQPFAIVIDELAIT